MTRLLLAAAFLFGSVCLAGESYLKVTSFEENQTLKIDSAYIDANYVDFRIFTDFDAYSEVCFVGEPAMAVELIESILNVTTGDSFILESELKAEENRILHKGTYTEGSGDYDFDLVFEVKRCKE